MTGDMWEVLVVLRAQAAMLSGDEPRTALRRPRRWRASAARSVDLAPSVYCDRPAETTPTKDDVALAG